MRQLIILISVFVALTKAQWDQPIPSNFESRTFPRFQARIVGGKESDPHQFPHQVILITDSDNFCTGTIIEENVILTSASCLSRINKKVKVFAGVHDRSKQEATQQIRESTKFKLHEEFKSDIFINNVGLVYLPNPLELNEYVKKIALYRGTSNLVDKEATVSGWGKTSDISESLSNILRHVTSKIISNGECQKFHPITSVRESSVCLSGFEGKSPCNGDSGAPLHIAENNKLYQAGIGSFGKKNSCEGGYPGVFSRVSSFAPWIDENKKPKYFSDL